MPLVTVLGLSVTFQELQKLIKFYDPSQEEGEKQEKKKDEVKTNTQLCHQLYVLGSVLVFCVLGSANIEHSTFSSQLGSQSIRPSRAC